LRFIAQAGIKKSIAVLRSDIEHNGFVYTSYSKYLRHNNPEKFKDIGIGQGFFSIYHHDTAMPDESDVRYGFTDEESKININYVPVHVLTKLITRVAVPDQDEAQSIAEAIVDWRTTGNSSTTGFYSDEFYDNLERPYPPKNYEFESFDELLLIRGVTPGILDMLKPFITIYGDGRININTAPAVVLEVAGFSSALVEKLLQVRRGLDGKEATMDDHVFLKTFDLASEISGFIKLTEAEVKEIDVLNDRDLLKLNSTYYRIASEAHLASRKNALLIECVYNSVENRIENWREK
jgi:type II secretory pathway component PulK